MKVPLNWLREYVGLNLPVAQLVERLTLAGLEVGGVRVYGLPISEGLRVKPDEIGPVWDRDKIVVGEVVAVEPHPDADKLKLPVVHHGALQPRTMVTGAPNLKVGDKGQRVILALAGAKLFDGHSAKKEIKELKPAKIRGVASDAMVCSAYELGISDEHEGIILLGPDAPVGKPLVDYIGDVVLDIDVLPNMARCLSMIGVAREVAALTGQELRRPKTGSEMLAEPIEGQVKVQIDVPQLCGRYAAMLIKGVRRGPAPDAMQWRLRYAGMRPIDNIVDITNYVMLEWGQPLHAFDYDVLKKRAGGQVPTIIVRSAKNGEVLKTLDGMDRKLTAENLVIADTAGPIALAGVMGGAETEVTAATTNILLESASFDAVSIRRTARTFDLPSEASLRFSRGVHPEIVRPAAERAAELLRQYAAGRVCKGIVEQYPKPLLPQSIHLDMDDVRQVLGVKNFPEREAVRILGALEFDVKASGPGELLVKTPPYRLDIQAGTADLIEELVRIHGYDKLPATLLADELPEQHTNRDLVLEERVRDILVAAGLQEVITYALTMPEREAPLGVSAEYVRLKNPISAERVVLRHSVLAGVLEVAARNLDHTEDVRLFEIGPVYLPRSDAKLPDEPRRLAVVLTGRRWPEFWSGDGRADTLDFYDLKGVFEALAGDLHLPEVSYRPAMTPYLHPGCSAALLVNGQPIGSFGELHPKLPAELVRTADKLFKPLVGRTLLIGELDLEALLKVVPDRYKYTPLSPFPAALRDIAVIVAEATPAERVLAEIRVAGSNLLRGVRLFDLYRGDGIPTGTKSLAFALTYQAEDRTLTDKEVTKVHEKIEGRLKHMLKAQIRGKE